MTYFRFIADLRGFKYTNYRTRTAKRSVGPWTPWPEQRE